MWSLSPPWRESNRSHCDGNMWMTLIFTDTEFYTVKIKLILTIRCGLASWEVDLISV